VTRPRLLDLFCGAGGAAVGYHRAGFDVVGVDIKPQPRYPFEFHQADMTFPLDGYDAIHASPPCQRFSIMTRKWARQNEHPDLIVTTQNRLYAQHLKTGALFVIENVPGAPLYQAVTLCGSMFGLQAGEGTHLRRHRIFESNVWFFPSAPCSHVGRAVGVYGNAGGSSRRDGITFATTTARNAAMGIDWMKGKELSEAIPPAYTEYVGKQLMAALA
jgi:DNA (cytosine-5)-methyltransferase 1